MVQMIKQILNRYFGSYRDNLDKFMKYNIFLRILIIPLFHIVYLFTLITLMMIVSIIVLIARPLSLIYKPHLKFNN